MLSLTTIEPPAPRPLLDGAGRRIDHLRLSVTAACNLRCLYCRPGGEAVRRGHGDLTDAQRVEFVEFLARRFGLKQVRITGGEPLLYPSLIDIVGGLRAAVPAIELALTTNGQRLAEMCGALRAAGLDRLNVSVDSLRAETYRRLTGGRLRDVLVGIDRAVAAGLPRPKINMVVLRGINDDELVSMARWGLSYGLEVRFLEAMPIGVAAEFNRRHFLAARVMRDRLAAAFELRPLPASRGETARRFALSSETANGVVGLIAPISEPFCAQCRRMRLTAGGRLYPCLLDDRFVDLRPVWRSGTFDAREAADVVLRAVTDKAPRGDRQRAPMVELGG